MYSLGNNKPLIIKDQNYVLDRKLLSVHSEDRDVSKWKNSNQFEITLPETINNVQTLRLVQITLPANLYIFSRNYQNTKMKTIIGATLTNIEIGEGIYDPSGLAFELKSKLGGGYDVLYDTITQKFWFTNAAAFSFLFDASDVSFNPIACSNEDIGYTETIFNNRYTNWGLGSYLGFDKNTYNSTTTLPVPVNNVVNTFITGKYYLAAPYKQNILGDNCIYMEVEKYNTLDELYPYAQSTQDMYQRNGISGKSNAAFSKIPLNPEHNEKVFSSRSTFLENISQYDPPIERISKLKFTFRHHDGRLVDFQNNNFDFTLEFNCLKNEIAKSYNVRVPHTFLM